MIKFKKANQKVIIISNLVLVFFFLLIMTLEGNWGYIISLTNLNEKAFMNNFSQTCVKIYEYSGEDSLKSYLLATEKKDKVKAFFFLPNNQVVSLKSPPKELTESIVNNVQNNWFANFYKVSNFFVYREKELSKTYKVAIDINQFKNSISFRSLPIIVRLCVSISFLSIVFYYISSVMYAPLKLIMQSITKVSKGKLETRIGPLVKNSNDELHQLGISFDKMTENIQSLMKTKDQTLNFIAHEFRTPLAKMRMALMLIRQQSDVQQSKDLEIIEKEISQMDKLIDEILTVAKLNTNLDKIPKDRFLLNPMLKELCESANYEMNEKRVMFVKQEPITVLANKNLLQRAVENIIRNAITYAGGEEMITVEAKTIKNSLVISVDDFGPGIPENELDKIFKPFVQSEKLQQVTSGGYGLGLAIVKKIVSLHQGKISAHNRSPHGLSVTITIPIIDS